MPFLTLKIQEEMSEFSNPSSKFNFWGAYRNRVSVKSGIFALTFLTTDSVESKKGIFSLF